MFVQLRQHVTAVTAVSFIKETNKKTTKKAPVADP